MITFREFLLEKETVPAKDKFRNKLARSFKDVLPSMQKYFVNATAKNFKDRYNAFLDAFPEEAAKIDSQRPDGVGPGEYLAAFVFNNITVGGKSAAIDLLKDDKPWAEVKAGDGSSTGGVADFKLDTEHSASSRTLLKNLDDFNKEYKKLTGEDLPGWKGAGEAGAGALRNWRKLDLIDFGGKDKNSTIDEIEDDWVAAIKDAYVKDKYFMLVNRKNLRVAYFGQLAIDMVDLLRTTRSQPKAAVAP